ncbi:MAG: ABC transporter substrate-binding protein [Bythopirellula sp.]
MAADVFWIPKFDNDDEAAKLICNENNHQISVRSEDKIRLAGLTWDDPRGYGPLQASDEAFAEAHDGGEISVRWDVQPLSGFENRPIAEVASSYDVIVMDHPHTFEAARRGCLIPITDLAESYVGETRQSYWFQGHQWAAPIDAACHVSAFVAGCASAPFRDWDEVFAAAKSGLRIAAPLAGVHSLMALLTLLASQGIDVDKEYAWGDDSAIESAFMTLRRLCDLSSVAGELESGLDWNPIEALNAVADGRCDYLPLTFGYAYFCDKGIRFANVPATRPDTAPRGILGGAGLAVSANSSYPEAAIEYVRFLASSHVQTECWSHLGGQPAHREAWNRLACEHSFYRDTRQAIETAFIRPRAADWNTIQIRAGDAITDWLRAGQQSCQGVVDRLVQLWTPLPA